MRKRAKTAVIIAVIIMLGFIWGHSMASAEVSGKESVSVMNRLTAVLEFFVGKGNVTDHLVRKLAHFAEFAVLGFFAMLLFLLNGRRTASDIYRCVLDILAAAVVDETIQLFSPGRAGLVQDILLDTLGGSFGILMIYFIALITVRARKRKHDDKEK